MLENIKKSFLEANRLVATYCQAESTVTQTCEVAKLIAQCFNNGNKVLICGNGGSICDAMHFAEEFTGRYRDNRRPLPVISLSDPAHITCTANDYGFEHVFSRGVEAFAKPGDILIALSTSGNSKNIINAVQTAIKLNIKTISFLGNNGGKLKGLSDHEFIIPATTSDRIQEIHMLILHIIIEGVERILFPENYRSNSKSKMTTV